MSEETVEGAQAPSTDSDKLGLPALTFAENDWFDKALCKGQLGKFFIERSRGVNAFQLAEKVQEAKQICFSCPVQMRCLRYAVRNNFWHGIWGGVDFDAFRSKSRSRKKLHKLRELL